MKTQEKQSPAQVADACEMLAQQEIDGGDREAAALFMDPAHAIRHLLRTLSRLNERVHNGYDFNADPDKMTLEVGEILSGHSAPTAEQQLNAALWRYREEHGKRDLREFLGGYIGR